jgi:hypothetical protein
MQLRTLGMPGPLAPHLDAATLRTFQTLGPVVRWALAKDPPVDIETVPLDEFTHDVVVPLADDLVLVFDTT